MSHKQELGIILNPAAGRGFAGRIKKDLIECLHANKTSFQLELTKYAGHAEEIAMRMSKEFKVVVAAGGDGTVNEVLSGIVGSKAALAFLPVGSGNDFSKIIGIPRKIDQALEIISKKQTKLVNVGEVIYQNEKGMERKRFFVNTLGIGLDAEIANETKQIKFLRGLPLYLLAAIKALLKHTANEYQISDKKKNELVRAFFICIGNGSFEGGGFRLLPNADPCDSFLDVCMLKSGPMLKALKVLPKVIKGTHEKDQSVFMWRTRKITIAARKPFIVHGDGEIFEENAIQTTIGLAPFKVKMILSNEL
jgi:diacylglycerol kinase (ATP)